MSAIQTLPFALDEHPATGTSNYADLVGRTYISNSNSGLYKLTRATAALVAELAGGPVGGLAVSSGLTVDYGAANSLADDVGAILGVAHPSLTSVLVAGDYFLVAVGGQAYFKGDAGGDLVRGAAVGSLNGEADAAAVNTYAVCLEAAPAGGFADQDVVLVEFLAEQVEPGV